VVLWLETQGRETCKSGKITFQPMGYMHFEYSTLKPGHVVASTYNGGADQHTFDLIILRVSVEWTLQRAYSGPVPLNEKKAEDLGLFMCYYLQCYMRKYCYSQLRQKIKHKSNSTSSVSEEKPDSTLKNEDTFWRFSYQ
jgi:hypothetical protein